MILDYIYNFQSQIWQSGTACIAVAAAIYSIAAALVRPLNPAMPVFEIVCIRSAISLLFSRTIATLSDQRDQPFFGKPNNYVFLAARGLVGAAAMDCFYMSIQRLPLGDAVSLLFTNPAMTAILAWLILKERLTWRGVVGSIASLVGMMLVVRPPWLHFSSNQPLIWSARRGVGAVFGFASAVLAAGAYLSIRLIGKKESSLTIAVWFHTSAVVHSTILLAIGWPSSGIWPTSKEWLCLLGIAISSFSANILLNRGFQQSPAALASAVNYSQVVYSHIIGVLIFGEALHWLGVMGAGLIAAGVVAVGLDSNKTKQQHDGTENADKGERTFNGGEVEMLLPQTTNLRDSTLPRNEHTSNV